MTLRRKGLYPHFASREKFQRVDVHEQRGHFKHSIVYRKVTVDLMRLIRINKENDGFVRGALFLVTFFWASQRK